MFTENCGKIYFIKTFGCQMNAHDSLTAAGILESLGYSKGKSMSDADIILFNTCCIRELAEKKAYAMLGIAQIAKKANKHTIIGVFGCMSQQESAQKRLKRRYPLIDFVFGTNNLHMLPEYIKKASAGEKTFNIEMGDPQKDFLIDPRHQNPPLAFTNIMQGCNNFCSYCIVPYVRGREVSRPPELILNEIEHLVANGYKEVTLLGQNVNSYGKDIEGMSFSKLLSVADAKGIERIRFMTSHPKDLTEELIDAIAGLKHVCKQIHLPVQSGADNILNAMNRRYNRKHYMGLVDKLRTAMPNIGITTDIIVGFPGETEADFEDTLNLVSEVRFNSAFMFAFSARPDTPAADMENQIDKDIKARRLNTLINIQRKISAEKSAKLVGKTYNVLIEGESTRKNGYFTGKTDGGMSVSFAGTNMIPGEFVNIEITKSNINSLVGKIADGGKQSCQV